MRRFDKADLSLLVRKPRFEFGGLSRLGRDVEFASADGVVDLSLLSTLERTDGSEVTQRGEVGRASEEKTYENSTESEHGVGDGNGDHPHFVVTDFSKDSLDINAYLTRWRELTDDSTLSHPAETSVDHEDIWARAAWSGDRYTGEIRADNELPPPHRSDHRSSQLVEAFQMLSTGENRLENGPSALQDFETRPAAFPNPTGRSEIFVSYTISEDRSGDSGGLQTTRLAALNDRTRASNTLSNDHDGDDLLGRFWSVDPLLHHLDEAYRRRLLMYVKEETDDSFYCLVPDCVRVTATREEWVDHIEDEHDDWNDDLREDFGLPPLPIDETGLEPQDIERLQNEAGVGRRRAVRTLRENDNDIEKAISSWLPGESAMEEVD